MGMSAFFDTNLFVYAVSLAPEDQDKRRIASGLIAEGEFSLSLQVIQEFIHTCLRKNRLGQTPDAIQATAEFLFKFPCAVPSQELVLNALALQSRFQVSYWDAAILAAAQELGCDQLYTEDLNHGQDYAGVRVINPFQ
jgi:predicted nucleic acid-binding protein